MIKQINNAFYKAITKAENDRPTIYILRGFTELVSKIRIPSELEAFDPYDLEGNYPRFILAEMFQILCLDDNVYDEVDEYSYYSPSLAPANVKDDSQLSLILFSLSLINYNNYKYSKTIKKMIELNYDFIYIDFNLYGSLHPDNVQSYFPINYESELHEDLEVFDDLYYPGIFENSKHYQAMIKYHDQLSLVCDKINVFNDDGFARQLLGEDSRSIEINKELSDAFFNYFSVYEKLN